MSGLQKNRWGLRLPALILAGLLLTSCRTEVRETFDLNKARVVAKEKSSPTAARLKNIQILIAAPQALKIFDGQEIVIDRAGSLSHLKGAQLGDRLPTMLQARLAQAFEDTGRLGGVSRPGEGLAIHYQILSDIRSFAIRISKGTGTMGAQAHVEIGIKIVDDRIGQAKATRVFAASSAIEGTDNHAYIQGLERALADILVQIVNWSFDAL